MDDSEFDRTRLVWKPRPLRGGGELTAGTPVGEFNATDPDESVLVYSLVAGEGDLGNKDFILSADGQLSTARVFDYEEQTQLVSGYG